MMLAVVAFEEPAVMAVAVARYFVVAEDSLKAEADPTHQE